MAFTNLLKDRPLRSIGNDKTDFINSITSNGHIITFLSGIIEIEVLLNNIRYWKFNHKLLKEGRERVIKAFSNTLIQ